ncbi:HET-domain-containing protein, partial [Paraphaeosphaeria sporulosa]
CLNNHGHLCSTHNIVTPKPRIRLIDVDKRCIVNGSGTENWVALSYVWGGANTVLMTTENINQHETQGSLEGILPLTIEDALRVTQALGERYLWVDCLCILQDCEEDKSIHLPRMGDIYRHAVVTIVAASGSNAAAGLPWIRNSITRSEQLFIQVRPSFRLGDYGVATMMDPPESPDCDYATGSPWSMRAWTFQERLLSRRVLIFTKDLIYWECEQSIWREDCFGELPAEFPQIFTSGFGSGTFWSHLDLSRLWRSHPFDIVNTYRQVVSHYTGLQLTYQEDGLHAISGVLAALEMRSGSKFLWGLPTAMLSAALIWESHSDDDATLSSRNQRRTAKHMLGPTQNSTSHCPFPSWSWVGW